MNEKSFSSKFYLPDEHFEDLIHRDVEIDLEETIMVLPFAYKHCLIEMKTKVGFVKIRVKEECECTKCLSRRPEKQTKERANDLKEYSSNKTYLRHHNLKKVLLSKISYTKKDYISGIRAILAAVTGNPYNEITIAERYEDITKSTVKVGFNVYIEKVLSVKCSLDLSYNIRLEWKPDVMKRWENRKRHWPNNTDLIKELNYGYVIAKPSYAEKNNPFTTEFRYSFAHIERKLVRLQSSTQRFIYLIFKSMFYKWIVPIDEDNISSYIAKTVMLWTCEKYPPHGLLWNIDGHLESIHRSLQFLLQYLSEAFCNKHLSYYFIPEINILGNVPNNVLSKTCDKVRMILLDVPSAIPSTTQTHLAIKVLEYMNRISENMFYSIKEFKNHGLKFLVQWRPDILFYLYKELDYEDIDKVYNTLQLVR